VDYIIVTGASRGLGAAFVRQALRDGASVIAVSTAEAPPIELTTEAPPERLTWITADLSDAAAAATGYADLTQGIDVALDRKSVTSVTLINNAATLEPLGLTGSEALHLSELPSAVNLNVTAPILMTNWFVRSFGSLTSLPSETVRTVVNISSGAARRVMPGLATYSATKAAINAFTASAAAETALLEEKGSHAPLRIVAVSPGIVETDMQKTLRSRDPDVLPERDMYASWHAEGKLKTPDHTARQILALAGRSDLPNGEFLHIDHVEEER
jgi:benzil reductase ((S)-benzoin forming)